MLIFREINGVKIACWVSSRDFSRGKITLFFIHGSGGDHSVWTEQYARLQNEFNIAAVDLPGHGSSGGQGEQDVSQYVEWIKSLLDALVLEKPVLVGHSLGAAISLVFAIKYGDMLSAIVPVGGGARMPVNPMILEGLKTDPDPIIALAAKFSVTKENRERLSQKVIDGLTRAKPQVLYGDLVACNKLDIANEVATIRRPTLVMCGEDDKMTPPALSQFLKDNIPGAQLSMIENAGHMAMLENVKAFNDALKSFVESLPETKKTKN